MGRRFFTSIWLAAALLAACGAPTVGQAGTIGNDQPRTLQTPTGAPSTAAPTQTATASAASTVTAAPITVAPAPRAQAPTTAPATAAPATAVPATAPPATAAAATVAPTSKPAGVVFTAVRSPVSRGGTGLVTVSTAPTAPCAITVTYKSGPSTAQGLTAKIADVSGFVTWTWNIGTNTTFGTWPIDVRCGGSSGRATFVVQ